MERKRDRKQLEIYFLRALVVANVLVTLLTWTLQPKQLMGDVNQDGKLSISDMAIIQSHILGNSKMTYGQMDLADMNNDTHIDVIDIMQIRRIILKKGE